MAVRALPLAHALVRRGHTVALFVPPWSYPADAGKVWDEDGVRIENVAIDPRALIAPRMAARVRAWKPDVVHFFKPKAYSGLAAWLFWYMRGVRLVRARLVVDEDDWEGAGGWNELENYTRLYKWFFAWQEQWGLRHCDAVTVASRALETIVWSLGVPPGQVHYLPYGLTPFAAREPEARTAVRDELEVGSDPVVLLYTRFFEFSVERLVEMFARIVQLVPRARLLIVGKGLHGEEERTLALAQGRGLRDRILYTGWVDESRLPGYFAAADIAIYPFDDTLINRCKCIVKLGDLLGAGLPVVAEAVGQIQEYIVHGETGLLVAPGGVEDFACTAAELLQDAARRAQLGTNAAARMAHLYNWDRLVGVAESAYGVKNQ